MLDINRPKGLQRRLARKRSSASQSGAHSSAARRDRSMPTGRRQAQTKAGERSVPKPPQREPRQDSTKARSTARSPESASGLNRTKPPRERQDRAPERPDAAKRRPPTGLLPTRLKPRQRPAASDQRHSDSRYPDSRHSDSRYPDSRHPDSKHPDSKLAAKAAQRSQRTSPLTYLVRLLIVGVGVGAIAGTVISVWNPSLRNPAPVNPTADAASPQRNANSISGPTGVQATVSSVRLGREMSELVVKVTPLMHNLTDLVPGVFVIDLDNGNFFNFNGSATFSSASMIKLPVLIAFFQDVDAGKIKLDEVLTIQQQDVAEGSGEMQYAGTGAQYSALETATNMIITSDNTATNMIIRRLGGIQVLNQRFRQWGLQQTMLRKPLPDLEGSNTTSPKELVSLMALLNDGKLISMKSRDRVFQIMYQTQTDTLLPSVMSPGSTVAHKTGDIGSLVGDVGVVDLPTGRRYAIAAMVKRPNNDNRAQDLIRQIAALVYENFGGQPTLAPSPIAPTQTMPQQPGMPMQSPGVTTPGMAPNLAPSYSTPGMAQPGIVPNAVPGTMPNPTPTLPAPMPNATTPTTMPVEPQAAPPATETTEPEAVDDPELNSDQADSNPDATDEQATDEEMNDVTFLPGAGWGSSR